ncbi:hypothetical protein NUW54_g13468 [Trametes sanguinea]|uniref:Uncharacterized protein n=1 Tax=Trametes sanguinea TaxID=158606 RepID=A0ACC1MKW6_9APHY|nr:hypothetical protein NUW54_g13468 [Trametes sanguinea]
MTVIGIKKALETSNMSRLAKGLDCRRKVARMAEREVRLEVGWPVVAIEVVVLRTNEVRLRASKLAPALLENDTRLTMQSSSLAPSPRTAPIIRSPSWPACLQRDVDVVPTKSPMSLELALGHGVEFGWSQAHGLDNEAVEILFNLLGGSNADRLEQAANWDRAIDDDPNLMRDDTADNVLCLRDVSVSTSTRLDAVPTQSSPSVALQIRFKLGIVPSGIAWSRHTNHNNSPSESSLVSGSTRWRSHDAAACYISLAQPTRSPLRPLVLCLRPSAAPASAVPVLDDPLTFHRLDVHNGPDFAIYSSCCSRARYPADNPTALPKLLLHA